MPLSYDLSSHAGKPQLDKPVEVRTPPAKEPLALLSYEHLEVAHEHPHDHEHEHGFVLNQLLVLAAADLEIDKAQAELSDRLDRIHLGLQDQLRLPPVKVEVLLRDLIAETRQVKDLLRQLLVK